MYVVHKLVVGPLQENCYLVAKDNRETLIFDPGAEGERIQALIADHQLKPRAIILTHAHYDHIGAVDTLRSHYQIPVYLHELEASWLSDPQANLSSLGGSWIQPVVVQPADCLFNQMGPVRVAGFDFERYHVPGHSPGSTVYIFRSQAHSGEEQAFAIVGDTLFHLSCGRTDFSGSSTQEQLVAGIKAHLMTLPEACVVYPGHGQATCIGVERQHNPFLR